MRIANFLAALALIFLSVAPAHAQKFGNAGGIGASSCTKVSGEPTGGTCPYSINGVTGVPTFSAAYNCANVVSYGADGTGTLFSDNAFTRALAAATPGKQCVYFPAGAYKFASSKTIALSSSYPTGSVTIQGDGQDATSLNFANGTDGLIFTFNSAYHAIHLRNLSLLGGTYSAGTSAVRVTQTVTVPNPANTAISDISFVTVRGNDGYGTATKGFGTGVELNQVSNFNLLGDSINSPNNHSGTCVSLFGTTTNVAVVFNITATTINFCHIGVNYGPFVQGVSVSQSNFTGGDFGIYSPADGLGGRAQLSVTGTQFNVYNAGIGLASTPDSVSILGNDFYVNSAINAAAGVQLTNALTYNILGNNFIGLGGNTTTGIGMVSSAAHGGSIAGNTFRSLSAGINLLAASSGVHVGDNIYGTLVTTPIINSSATNFVGVDCAAGAPTSSFSSKAGVVTHC